jgi:hypothetical protein
MKNLKTILSVFAVAAVFSSTAFAQETANVAVDAVVESSITLTPGDINLGTIQQATSTIKAGAADVTTTETNLGAGATSGSLKIDGTSDVNVSWTTATLVNGTSGQQTTFTPIVFNGASSISSGSTVTLSTSVTLGVGGTLTAPSGTGSYTTGTSGTETGSPITFTVEYN